MNENETNTAEEAGSDPTGPAITKKMDDTETETTSDIKKENEPNEAAVTEEGTTSASDEDTEFSDRKQDPEVRIEVLEAQVEELNDKLLRALAETENVRRRAQRDKEDAAKYGIKNFAEGMLGIADNLGRALASIDPDTRSNDPTLENILVGVEMVQKELMNTFERYGVTPIKALGAKFDPMLHEAMFEIEDKEAAAGTVAQVLEPGYELNGRTLRAAKVGITKGGAKETAGPEEDLPETSETGKPSDQASRDGQAAYESHADSTNKSGGNLDQEL